MLEAERELPKRRIKNIPTAVPAKKAKSLFDAPCLGVLRMRPSCLCNASVVVAYTFLPFARTSPQRSPCLCDAAVCELPPAPLRTMRRPESPRIGTMHVLPHMSQTLASISNSLPQYEQHFAMFYISQSPNLQWGNRGFVTHRIFCTPLSYGNKLNSPYSTT